MGMRAEDLDTTGPVWCWSPKQHKNAHRGRERVIFLGPQAQEVVRPFLRVTCPICNSTDLPRRLGWRSGLCGPCADHTDERGIMGPWPVLPPADHFLFSPRDAMRDLYASRAASRKTKARSKTQGPGFAQRHRERYDRHSYHQAVERACKRAAVEPWSPLQLRHTAATRIRSQYGVETARVILGHTRVETSQIYAERDLGRAQEVMKEIG
jgi:integrase